MRAHERDKRQEGHLGKYDSFDVTLLCKAVRSLRKNMWYVIVFCSVVPIRSRSPSCGCRSLME